MWYDESKEESYHCVYKLGQRYLYLNLYMALKSIVKCETDETPSCAMFEIAFFNIVQSGSCYTLAKDTFALVDNKAKELLRITAERVENSNALESNFRMLCWLFKILLNGRGARQLVARMILSDLSFRLRDTFRNRASELFRAFKWAFKWTLTMISIFEEVIAGRLLLNSSMRVRLINQWDWLFGKIFLNKDKDEVLASKLAKTLSSFMKTLDLEDQSFILQYWLLRMVEEVPLMPEVLELAHPMWIKDLQRNLVALESARASEIAAKTSDPASSPSPASSE